MSNTINIYKKLNESENEDININKEALEEFKKDCKALF